MEIIRLYVPSGLMDCRYKSTKKSKNYVRLHLPPIFFITQNFNQWFQTLPRLEIGRIFHRSPACVRGFLRRGSGFGHSHRRAARQVFRRNELLVLAKKSSRKLRLCRPVDQRRFVKFTMSQSQRDFTLQTSIKSRLF